MSRGPQVPPFRVFPGSRRSFLDESDAPSGGGPLHPDPGLARLASSADTGPPPCSSDSVPLSPYIGAPICGILAAARGGEVVDLVRSNSQRRELGAASRSDVTGADARCRSGGARSPLSHFHQMVRFQRRWSGRASVGSLRRLERPTGRKAAHPGRRFGGGGRGDGRSPLGRGRARRETTCQGGMGTGAMVARRAGGVPGAASGCSVRSTTCTGRRQICGGEREAPESWGAS